MKHIVQILCAVFLFSTTVSAKTPAIKIVGSSTVYPFTTVVAERFGQQTEYPTPVVESTGTGGGMKLFCAGVTTNTPSVTNASRAIKSKEKALCEKNGVSWIEIAVGNDIKVMVPPPTSGTRDAWNSLVMGKGCPKEIKDANKKDCNLLREDGAMVEAGENDTLLIQKLMAEPEYFAYFGFSYLDNARDKVQAATIEGATISLDSIQDYSYPIARPLYIYFKKEHIGTIPGLREFMKAYVSRKAMGSKGYLIDRGLVPLDKATYKEMVSRTK